jgi:hypothetical protein
LASNPGREIRSALKQFFGTGTAKPTRSIHNSFFGFGAGLFNNTGNHNSFFGYRRVGNDSGESNTAISF